MPKRRVSLADLHRTAVGQGQALLGTVPAEAPRALGGFDTHGISQHTPPDSVSVLVDAVHSYSRQQRGAAG